MGVRIHALPARSHIIKSISPGDRPNAVSRTAASARNCVPWFNKCSIASRSGCTARLTVPRLTLPGDGGAGVFTDA